MKIIRFALAFGLMVGTYANAQSHITDTLENGQQRAEELNESRRLDPNTQDPLPLTRPLPPVYPEITRPDGTIEEAPLGSDQCDVIDGQLECVRRTPEFQMQNGTREFEDRLFDANENIRR